MQQVDSEDASFLFLEKADSPSHISALYLYDQSGLEDERVRFKEIRKHIQNRLNSAPVFRQRLRRVPGNLDYPYWIKDKRFDLDFHVRHLALPKPGDWRQFCIQIARLHSRQLDMTRPPWELYVIEGLDNMEGFPPNCFALYFKVHHSAMDEFTAQELVMSLHQRTPNRKQHEGAEPQIFQMQALDPTVGDLLVRAWANNTVKSAKLALQALQNMGSISKFVTRSSLRFAQQVIKKRRDEDLPQSRFNQTLSPSRVFEGAVFDKTVFERLATEVDGAEVSHVVLTVIGEALRLYLEGHDELGDAPLQALLAVNVRNAGAHALTGNHIAINEIGLQTSVDYPIDRLQAIYSSHQNLHAIQAVETTGVELRKLYENLPAPLLSWLGRTATIRTVLGQSFTGAVNCGLTEMDGPTKPLYLQGAELLMFSSVAPIYTGCSLVFCTSTYQDKLSLTFTSDRNIMPDPEFMRACLIKAVDTVEISLRKTKPVRLRAVKT
nr:putative wax ester synthase/acyl-CoA:diacylglycerol acyltransferase [uncultured bacterium]